ncbi:hypothetical protein GpartN1_g5067.t1 [Galdieria partita]|uniref:RING-type domain-containing protein n=1 Tax=Galdieria partita TaxID=83374 RepID=A0A9C7Q0I1_9RHOD|nr:hypothetical protein GpartN1_g5067.t1 [Galdieria partita]
MERLVSVPETCCICLEETLKLLQLIPCQHIHVCTSCVYRLDDMKCPTCRQQVDFVDLNFYLKDSLTNTNFEEMKTISTSSIRIPLQLLLQYRRKELGRLISSTFQVYFVGSSGIPLSGNVNQVLEKFAYKMDCLGELEDRKKHKSESDSRVQRIEALKQYLKNNFDNKKMESLFDLLFDMNQWKRYYSANAFIDGKLIRFGCFAFWEFLSILRSAGSPDGILPDVIITCVNLCNETNIKETLEMQNIMTKTYRRRGRILHNIWLDTSESQFEERRSPEDQLGKIFDSMTETVWPRKVVVLPKLLNSKEISKLGNIIVNECIKSRKGISFKKQSSAGQ